MKLTKNQKEVLHEIGRAEASGALCFLVLAKSGWNYGDYWVNHLTAKSLVRKGFARIDWGFSEDDYHCVYPAIDDDTLCLDKNPDGRPCERDKGHDGIHMNYSGAAISGWRET